MRFRFLIIGLVFVIILLGIANAKLVNSPWPMFQHDLNHTGQSQYNGTAKPDIKWNYPTGDVESSPAIALDGTIYIAGGKKLYAFYPNGTLKWSFTINTTYSYYPYIKSSPAIASDGTIYFGSKDNNLYALFPNGSLKWKYTTNDDIDSSPAIASDGTVYFGSDDDYIYALYPNGTLKWRFKAADWIDRSSPAVGSDGIIYITANNPNGGGKLYAVYPNGTQKWSINLGNPKQSVTIGKNGTIYVGASDSNGYSTLYALYPENGSIKWNYTDTNQNYDVYSTPAVAEDGTIYIPLGDTLYAFYSNGTVKWNYTIRYTDRTPIVDTLGNVYIAVSTKLYSFYPDGTLRWVFSANEGLYFPAIGSDGTIYIGSSRWPNRGKLYALNDLTPPTIVVISPLNRTTLLSRVVQINISASDPSGVNTVIAEIDGIANITLSLNNGYYVDTVNLTDGRHTIRIYANDSLGNVNSSVVAYFSIGKEISSCTNIVESGYYQLTGSVINSTETVCINISTSNVVFDGRGYVIDGIDSANTYGIYISDNTNVTIKNLRISDWNYGIYFNNTQNGGVENVVATSNEYGIKLLNSNNNSIISNYVGSNDYNGIELENSSNNIIKNNIVTTNKYKGLYINYSNNNTITDNNLSYNNRLGYWNNAGLYLLYSDSNTITKNHISNNRRFGVIVKYSNKNTFEDNNVVNNCGNTAGIYIESSNLNLLISNNISYNTGDGIQIRASSNNTISNNIITRNDINGIVILSGGGSYNNISNNNISSNNYYGIAFSGEHYSIIESNEISYNRRGILLYYSHNNEISGNIIKSSGEYGIFIYSSANNSIFNNYFNNSNNYRFYRNIYTNYWNTTKHAGTNVIGGPYIGGNFWAAPNGTGFSETCNDSDDDGICDNSYSLITNNVDHLPLRIQEDKLPPIISMISPINGSYLEKDKKIYIKIIANEDLSKAWIEISGKKKINISLKGLGRIFKKNISLEEGRYNIRAYGIDIAGNIGKSPLYTITIVKLLKLNATNIIANTSSIIINTSDVVINVSALTNTTLNISTIVTSFSLYQDLNKSTSLGKADKGVKYIEVKNNTPVRNLSKILVKIHFTKEELENLDPNTLALFYWNGSAWISTIEYENETIPDNRGGLFVYEAGRFYDSATGKGYVYAVVNHTSVFAIGGKVKQVVPTPSAGGEYSPEVVILANSIDLSLAKELVEKLKKNGIKVYPTNASNFSEYKTKRYIIVLGGHEAYEGIGDIVTEITTSEERANISKGKVFIKKKSVFRGSQTVYIFAGANRFLTAEAWKNNINSVIKEIKYNIN